MLHDAEQSQHFVPVSLVSQLLIVDSKLAALCQNCIDLLLKSDNKRWSIGVGTLLSNDSLQRNLPLHVHLQLQQVFYPFQQFLTYKIMAIISMVTIRVVIINMVIKMIVSMVIIIDLSPVSFFSGARPWKARLFFN